MCSPKLSACSIITRLWHYRGHQLTIGIDGAEFRAATVIATTGRRYAGPFVIAPDASVAEPLLDFVLFRRSGRLAVLRYLAALAHGSLPRRADVTLLRGREAFVSASDPVPVQADGEIVAQLPVAIGIAAAPLRFVRP